MSSSLAGLMKREETEHISNQSHFTENVSSNLEHRVGCIWSSINDGESNKGIVRHLSANRSSFILFDERPWVWF